MSSTESTVEVLTSDAVAFLTDLHRQFEPLRIELLKTRLLRQTELNQSLLKNSIQDALENQISKIKKNHNPWQVALAPLDLNDRRVEITGPAEPKMMINALNSGAKVFMADFEDSFSPTWKNVLQGQIALKKAVNKTLSFTALDGKKYLLKEKLATLVVRPRGWHLVEKNFITDGTPISASLFDFGLYFFHNAKSLLNQNSGPYFYLPKIESHLEARLWNEVFIYAQKTLGLANGTLRATVLIETLFAALEMEEILFELKDHAAGLNAGRWDYIFSFIKKLKNSKECIFPDRSQITMAVPFMKAYSQQIIKTCHRHGAHAIGGMSAFIPNRKDPLVTQKALELVKEDKLREAMDGFDGTWVAHPDLVPVAQAVFDSILGPKAHQKDKLREDLNLKLSDLVHFGLNPTITEQGMRTNVQVSLQYLQNWLKGVGAVAIHNLMEDVATAEISRAQLWQWIHHEAILNDGRKITPSLYKQIRDEEIKKLNLANSQLSSAQSILDDLVLNNEFKDFLTEPAYPYLN